ncbi:hypothetical protein BJY01DRAFT_246868 [Aspergillus pseudoustus]|uniref:Uncharacterized protein n=1 Tax=Aspergillus pseudoustus TaxID=1810923 RepID=A0ABR4K4G0_9EURO
MTAALSCENQPISPLRAIIDLLICISIAASLIPQIVRFAILDQSSGAGVSGWYMILLTVSANAYLAARTRGTFTKASYDCVRNGEISGWKGFSALMMWIQSLVPWVASVTLLVVYVYFRHGHRSSSDNEPDIDRKDVGATLHALRSYRRRHPGPIQHSHHSNSRDTRSYHHPPALFVLLHKLPVYDTMGSGLFQQLLYIVLTITGLATSVAAPIPQVYDMVARFSEGLSLGSLSILSAGL